MFLLGVGALAALLTLIGAALLWHNIPNLTGGSTQLENQVFGYWWTWLAIALFGLGRARFPAFQDVAHFLAVGLLARLAGAWNNVYLTSWSTLNLFRAAVAGGSSPLVFGNAQTSAHETVNQEVLAGMLLCHISLFGFYAAALPWKAPPRPLTKALRGALAAGLLGAVGAIILWASSATSVVAAANNNALLAMHTSISAGGLFVFLAAVVVLGLALEQPAAVYAGAGLLVMAQGGFWALADLFYTQHLLPAVDSGRIVTGYVFMWVATLGVLAAVVWHVYERYGRGEQRRPNLVVWLGSGFALFLLAAGLALLYFNAHNLNDSGKLTSKDAFEVTAYLLIGGCALFAMYARRVGYGAVAALLTGWAGLLLLRVLGSGHYSSFAHANVFRVAIESDAGFNPLYLDLVARPAVDQQSANSQGFFAGFVLVQVATFAAWGCSFAPPVRKPALAAVAPALALLLLGGVAAILLWASAAADVQIVQVSGTQLTYYTAVGVGAWALFWPVLLLFASACVIDPVPVLGPVVAIVGFRGLFVLSETCFMAATSSQGLVWAGGILAWLSFIAFVGASFLVFTRLPRAVTPSGSTHA